MTQFTGQSEHKLDAKGRLFVPRRLVDAIDEPVDRSRFLVTIGQDPCLYLFTRPGFDSHLGRIRDAVRGTEGYAEVMRGVSALTSDQTLDSQSRILLPEQLREHAGLEKEVVVLGVFEHVEIWDVARWQERAASAQEAYLKQASVFFRGGTPGAGGAS